MNDTGSSAETQRAEQARANLLQDLREIKKMGDKMIEKTETAIHKAPALLGIGAAGVALIGIAVLASRRRPASLFRSVPRERSFFAEAARAAALSALGILSGRLTQHLLAAALDPAPAE
jgi:hypothetical protein